MKYSVASINDGREEPTSCINGKDSKLLKESFFYFHKLYLIISKRPLINSSWLLVASYSENSIRDKEKRTEEEGRIVIEKETYNAENYGFCSKCGRVNSPKNSKCERCGLH